MPVLHKYLLEPVSKGGFRDKIIDGVLEILKSVLESTCDYETFMDAVNSKLRDRFGSAADGSYTLVTGLRKNLFLMIRGMERKDQFGGRIIGSIKVKAKFQGVRSLQDLAAYQVSCCVPSRNNLEELPIPPLVERVVVKFIDSKMHKKLYHLNSMQIYES